MGFEGAFSSCCAVGRADHQSAFGRFYRGGVVYNALSKIAEHRRTSAGREVSHELSKSQVVGTHFCTSGSTQQSCEGIPAANQGGILVCQFVTEEEEFWLVTDTFCHFDVPALAMRSPRRALTSFGRSRFGHGCCVRVLGWDELHLSLQTAETARIAQLLRTLQARGPRLSASLDPLWLACQAIQEGA